MEEETHSEIAHANPNPSYVLVPLPSSSITTKLSFVACLKIALVSSISAIKVDTPLSWLSPAPTRQRTESKMGTSAKEAGTKEPTWARRAMRAVWRMKTDLPPALGPVMMLNSLTSATRDPSARLDGRREAKRTYRAQGGRRWR